MDFDFQGNIKYLCRFFLSVSGTVQGTLCVYLFFLHNYIVKYACITAILPNVKIKTLRSGLRYTRPCKQ